MPQMFPMSMLILSMVVMGILMVCLIRLFWNISTPSLTLLSPSLNMKSGFKHFW